MTEEEIRNCRARLPPLEETRFLCLLQKTVPLPRKMEQLEDLAEAATSSFSPPTHCSFAGLQAQDGRRGQHPHQESVQVRRQGEEHAHRRERRQQRHSQAAGRDARGGEAFQGE